MEEEKTQNVIVIKRDGKRVPFDGLKIAIAIKKGFDSIEGKYTDNDVNKIYNKVIEKIISTKNLKRINMKMFMSHLQVIERKEISQESCFLKKNVNINF